MNILSLTQPNGDVFTASFDLGNNGWYVDQNGHSHVYVPYSRIFKINGIEYMATVASEALRLGKMMIKLEDEAFVAFEKNHPELNP